MPITQPSFLALLAASASGSLALDGWKCKYQKSHIFGARFSFISSNWDLLCLVCVCDAGLCF